MDLEALQSLPLMISLASLGKIKCKDLTLSFSRDRFNDHTLVVGSLKWNCILNRGPCIVLLCTCVNHMHTNHTKKLRMNDLHYTIMEGGSSGQIEG